MTTRRPLRTGKFAYKLVFWGGFAWMGLLIALPYRRYQSARYQGPPDISEWDSVSPSLAQSRTVSKYINPYGCRYWGDTRSVTFNNLRDRKSGKLLSDAEILKRLSIGFWGGGVFAYEQSLLKGWPKDRVKFDMERKADRGDMFATMRMGAKRFELEKGDHLWRTFQVLDVRIRPAGQEKVVALTPRRAVEGEYDMGEEKEEESSYIDFGYGSSEPGSKFAGVHRFSVTRLPPELQEGSSWQMQRQNEKLEQDGGRVKITFESYTCSPTPGGGTIMEWGWKLHKMYAYWLFSSGVAAVVRGVGRSKGA